MLAYLLKRLLISIPTLFVISVLVFFISIHAPGDPVINLLSKQSVSGEKYEGSNRASVLQKRKELGLDKPIFYLELGSLASYPCSEKIPFQREREMLKELSLKTGRPDLVHTYYLQLLKAEESETTHLLLGESDIQTIGQLLQKAANTEHLETTFYAFQKLKENTRKYRNYVPIIKWNTADNQYHHWLRNLFSGNLGYSYSDGLKVSTKLWDAMKVTLSMSIAALFLAIAVAIILATLAIYLQHTFLPALLDFLFLSLYSIPTFILATFAMIFLGSSQYLDLFPVYGMGNYDPSMNFWEVISEAATYLFLPIISLAYLSTAFLYQQLVGNLRVVMQQEYITAARAKGLTKLGVIRKHALRNSLLPLLAYMGNIFPAIIGGSFVVEFIFSLPGMGMLTMDAVFARDYPVVFAALLIVSLAALIGALLSDLLLLLADPRISLQNKST